MITLTQAFHLCDIDNEHITLVDAHNPHTSVWGWSENFKKKFDFHKMEVVKIKPSWHHDGDFAGMKFYVKVEKAYQDTVFPYKGIDVHLDIY